MEEQYLTAVLNILAKYPYTFYAFGSRVKGTHRKFSDLDLCFVEPIPIAIQGEIREDFEESNLPFKVDLVDFNRASTDFQNKIRSELQLLQEGPVTLKE